MQIHEAVWMSSTVGVLSKATMLFAVYCFILTPLIQVRDLTPGKGQFNLKLSIKICAIEIPKDLEFNTKS